MFNFSCDYMESAHPKVLQRVVETNFDKTGCYGCDCYSDSAREKIRSVCACPNAEIHFLVGGTQTNQVVISSILQPYQGVLAAKSGHISVHEAGAIERAGHKVMELEHTEGKLTAETVEKAFETFHTDGNRDHMVMPGAVYITQPTEYGSLYSRTELQAISEIAHRYGAKLYLDGARLLYALASKENDVTLADIAKYCDAFYIGGTKAGTMFGEAVVFPVPGTVPHFFTITKQMGALLAKGKVTGVQFEALFTDDLYKEIGETADRCADLLRDGLAAKGFRTLFSGRTNQVFLLLSPAEYERLSGTVVMSFWEKIGEDTVVRLATNWASTEEQIREFLDAI